MSTEVDKAFVQQFSSAVILLAQQKGSKLRGTVRTDMVQGKYAHFDRIGKVEATKVTSRHQNTPDSDIPHSRRRVTLDDYVIAAFIDNFDEIRMKFDPKGPYVQTIGMGLGRQMDLIIIDKMLGNASSIDASDSSSNVALPASQRIDEDFATANSDIIVEKVVEAQKILRANEVDMDEQKTFVLDAIALANMLQQTEVASFDYNSVKALVHGEINTFMGFNFIQTELLNNTSGELFVDCMAYTKSALGIGLGSDISIQVDKRPDKLNLTQVLGTLTMGAVRIEEEKVIAIEAYRA